MPRQKRVDVAGVTYHAINRGNARLTIFHKPEDYDAFIRLMAEGLERYQVDLFAFTLMPNHWHFGVATGEGWRNGPIATMGHRNSFSSLSLALPNSRVRSHLSITIQKLPCSRR